MRGIYLLNGAPNREAFWNSAVANSRVGLPLEVCHFITTVGAVGVAAKSRVSFGATSAVADGLVICSFAGEFAISELIYNT